MAAPWRLDLHVDCGNRKVKDGGATARLNAVARRPRLGVAKQTAHWRDALTVGTWR